jgi:hypothetical protein
MSLITTSLSTYQVNKAKFFEMFQSLLDSYETDITTGLEDGTYKESENVETQQFIKDCKAQLAIMQTYTPTVYAYIEGGNLQGVSATEAMEFKLFDKDNYYAEVAEVEEDEVALALIETPEQWDAVIIAKTEAKEIIDIY